MSEVRLTGHLVCADAREAALVVEYLPEHTALTRTEPACLSFTVKPTSDPFTWQVDELFASEATFDDHQRRSAASK